MRVQNNNSSKVFFELVRAGLWEKEVRLSQFGAIDYAAIMQLAEEQSLVGLVTAGLEHVSDVKVLQAELLQYIGSTLQIEQQGQSLNEFINWLMAKLKEEHVSGLLVKGQGVAQCYERPLWRSSGDVDLILDEENYQRGKIVLSKMANSEHEENPFDKHFSVEIKGLVVELHGTMRGMLTKRVDDYVDALQVELFLQNRHRVWNNNGKPVLLPCPDDDVIFVFTHILKHFFNYGIGLRQFCDWCRLLYKFHDEIDVTLLETRLKKMGLMTEWKVFGALAVNWLGMSPEYVPFYSPAESWKRKANRVISFVLETGNFGHSRDNSRYANPNKLVQKLSSLWQHTCDSFKHSFIFPVDSARIWGRMFVLGICDALKGK